MIFYGANESKIHISYLTVDIDKYIQEPKGDGSGKILYVGSLIERKGIDLLLLALSNVKNNYILYIAGDGDERTNLEELSLRLGISNKVVFLGHQTREQLVTLYGKSDIFILPTREDCFALVILEAMCSKLPVVCSKYADGVYDLITDGENGYVVDPYDSKMFGKRIDKLLSDENTRKVMQLNSEKVINKFRFENVAIDYVEAIKEGLDFA